MPLPVTGNRLANLCTVATLLLCLGGVGCGYHLAPTGNPVGASSAGRNNDGQKAIFVATFTNNTPEPNIEMRFRNAFIDQFIKGRRFKFVDAEGLAEVVLKGNIKNLVMSPLAYRSGSNLAIEKRITVTLSLSLEAKGTASTLWREENFSQWADYTLDDTSFSASQAGQKNALSKLANDAAERAYRMMTADF